MRLYQTGRFTISVDANMNIRPTTMGNLLLHEVRTGTVEGEGTLLLAVLNRWLFYFRALPGGADLIQYGTTGAWKIILNTTVQSNKAIFIPSHNTAIKFDSTVYEVQMTDGFFPVHINRISDGVLMCRIDEDGGVFWPDDSVFTVSAIGTTGLIQFQIN